MDGTCENVGKFISGPMVWSVPVGLDCWSCVRSKSHFLISIPSGSAISQRIFLVENRFGERERLRFWPVSLPAALLGASRMMFNYNRSEQEDLKMCCLYLKLQILSVTHQ